MSVRWMEVKGTYGILTFFSFIATNPYGGCQHDTRHVLGGRRATHLVRCKVYWRYLEFCFKVHFTGL